MQRDRIVDFGVGASQGNLYAGEGSRLESGLPARDGCPVGIDRRGWTRLLP